MSSDVLLEEFEVLQSIYPTELTQSSPQDIQIEVEPDDPIEGSEPLRIVLHVHYPDQYPEALPVLRLEDTEDALEDNEKDDLLTQLETVGQENIGMAMTFTLVSQLREELSRLVRARAEKIRNEEMEKERLALEAEEARTRGTPVTVESFREWKIKFDKEMAQKKAREDEEKLKGLTPKEREEFKRLNARLSGRQLFERNRNLEDESLLEEGTVSVDVSQYERTRVEDEEEEGVTFSDSE
ncbi:RWD domain-containing protein [Pluteus cervinus]|uniref:RWD domain-containing protein n=1 Tax=Pluteus cervinus TaxID=181527 RepID=A0ACD3BED3_9AGAR|nr:RWD domain-containing protein [Pluteus cervinus]